MERRDFLQQTVMLAGGAWAAAVAPTIAHADDAPAAAVVDKLRVQNPDVLKHYKSALNASVECTKHGEVCVRHCQDRLAEGNKAFAHCSTAAQQMVTVSDLMTRLLASHATRVSEFLDGSLSTLKACKEACDEHKEHWAHGMHLECKACSEACGKAMAEYSDLKKAIEKA